MFRHFEAEQLRGSLDEVLGPVADAGALLAASAMR